MAEQPAVELTRTFAAKREKIFAAWTDPDMLSRWFGPSAEMTTEAETDVRVGGRYRFRVVAPDGAEHVAYGEYREIEPPARLVFTWAWESGWVTDSLVTVSLREVDGGTELTLRHERLATEEMRQRHTEGWNGSFQRLEAFVG